MEPVMLTALLGGVVGLLLALTGAGGGVLAVPLLVFGLHLGVAQAAPIGLIAVGLAAAIGAALGLRAGIVRYRAAGVIGGLGMLVAPLGVLAGLLVGVGVRMANGCTSGHGVCGLSRCSGRSLANVLAFMGAGATCVFVVRHVLA